MWARTTVRLLFPAVPTPEPEPREPLIPDAEHESPSQLVTLLLVEDDLAVRRVLKRTLSGMGHTVLEAESGRQALQVAERHMEGIDVVLTDVVMPEMGGVELLECLRELCPEVQVVLMSGYSQDELTEEIREMAVDFLEKPFTRSEVERVIRSALDQSR